MTLLIPKSKPQKISSYPFVSIVVPVFNEQKNIKQTIEKIIQIDYPNFDIIIVNDGSTDQTLEVISEYDIKIINKHHSGKAQILNEVVAQIDAEIILFLDADAEPEKNILNEMISCFNDPKIGLVAGRPKIKNTNYFITKLQVIEYCGFISLFRTGLSRVGCVMSVSGAVLCARKEALLSVGGFSLGTYAEDIDLAWKCQKANWKVKQIATAIVWTSAPITFKLFFQQRYRWMRGWLQVIRRNFSLRFTESILSLIWIIGFVGILVAGKFFDWLIIAIITLLIHSVGIMADKKTIKFLPYILFYPIFYWIIMAIILIISLPELFKPVSQKPVLWQTYRES